MTYKPRSERKRAKGGKAEETEPLHPEHGHLYNAEGSPESKEIDAKSDGFKRGGKAKKRKEGGKVEGHEARHHLGRRARGGAAHEEHEKEKEKKEHERKEHEPMERARGGRTEKAMARGGSPFSTAQHTKPPGNDKDGPGEQAPMIP